MLLFLLYYTSVALNDAFVVHVGCMFPTTNQSNGFHRQTHTLSPKHTLT